VIAGIAAGFSNQYNDFQSIAGDPGGNSPDEPRANLEANGKDFATALETSSASSISRACRTSSRSPTAPVP
jgi:hypothetical protein